MEDVLNRMSDVILKYEASPQIVNLSLVGIGLLINSLFKDN